MPDNAEYIQFLKDTIEYLKTRVSDLETKLLAVTDAKAYTLLHPNARTEPREVRASLAEQIVKPELTREDIEKQFES